MTHIQRLTRLAYQVAFPVLWLAVITTRRRLRGVRTVIVHSGRILLVRHTYGDRRRWSLPGGGIKRGENLARAAAREAREEVGLTITPRQLGAVSFRRFGTDVTTYGYWAEITLDARVIRDPVELAAAEWFDLDDLPELAPGIPEVIDMYRELVKNA